MGFQYSEAVDILRQQGGLDWEDVDVILHDQPEQYHVDILKQFIRTIPKKQRTLTQSNK